MTYKQFINGLVKPYLKEGDKPANRQVFHIQKDTAHRDGVITDKQVQNWIYPKTRMYV